MGNLLPRSKCQRAFLGSGGLVKIAHLDCQIKILPQQKWPAPKVGTAGLRNIRARSGRRRARTDQPIVAGVSRIRGSRLRVPWSLNQYAEPSQQFSKLVLVDQKIRSSRKRGQYEHPIPHGLRPCKVALYGAVQPNSQALVSINAGLFLNCRLMRGRSRRTLLRGSFRQRIFRQRLWAENIAASLAAQDAQIDDRPNQNAQADEREHKPDNVQPCVLQHH